MKIVLTILTVFVLSFALIAQDHFDRTAVLPAQPKDIGGFGNIISGVDIDGDGLLEIYAVNDDWHDQLGLDLKPRIYKYEQDGNGGWQIVWNAEMPFNFQNTWPAFEVGDLDNDGKMEIVWGPVNNFGGGSNANPERIVVFETPGDGTDVMGIDNGDGTFSPNAQWTIETVDNTEYRPFRWMITDIDNDGTSEIVTASRRGENRARIFSVSDVPDNGDGSEVWTTEFAGGGTTTYYDLAVIDSMAYFIASGGDVLPVSWDAVGDSFAVGAVQSQVVPNGSWKSASVVDVDNDGTKEIIVASWNSATSNVYLLQQDGDSLKTTLIKDVPDAAFRLYGGAAGDLDNDGNVDFVFGTRQATPNASIYRLEYQGGAIDDPANWALSLIDSDVSKALQYDVISVADVDGDSEDEVIYSGTPRGLSSDEAPQPIVILNRVPGNQPVIKSIVDVDGDNGFQVRVDWIGAADDTPGGGASVITEYSVWRKVEDGSQITGKKIIHLASADFEQVGSTTAIQASEYALTVPTIVNDQPSHFVVFAHTSDPLTNYHSLPKMGTSVDNLIPTAPSGLIANEVETGVSLAWNESPDEDFNYFSVVRGSEAGFDPNAAEEIGTTTSTAFVDANVASGETWYYRVVAFDFSGNKGEFSDEISLQVTSVAGNNSTVPESFALEQNYPNPFNPTTNIRYDLAKDSKVSLKIYNLMGQEVANLVNESQRAGRYTVSWNATNNAGVKVSSGVYIYVLKAGKFVQSQRLTLLK